MPILSAITQNHISARTNAITRLEMYKFMLSGDMQNGRRAASVGDALLSESPHITAYLVEQTLASMVQRIDKSIAKLQETIDALRSGNCPACHKNQVHHCRGCGSCNFSAGEASIHREGCEILASV